MDPVTGYVVKAGASWLGSKFKALVIDRWARHRAEAFFEAFVEELAASDDSGQPLSNMEPILEEMLSDKMKSEALFDAYRRVSLSASRDFGPRIIAVVTARIVAGQRLAEPAEERLMMAAEILNDDDLLSFCAYVSEHPPDRNYEVKIHEESDDSSWRRDISIGPLEISNWCLKLQNIGLVVQDVVTRSWDYGVDPENHVDVPGTATKYTWILRFQEEVLELKGIIESLRK
jgi:hypothetical protein